MKSFKDWAVQREENQEDVGAGDLGNNSLPSADSENETLHKAADLAWKSNKPKLMATLRSISAQEDSGELRELVEELEKNQMSTMNQSNLRQDNPRGHDKRDNEIVPSMADTGQGLDSFESRRR